MTPHSRYPRDPRQLVCEIPADHLLRREAEDTPGAHTFEDCLSNHEEAARPDDASHPIGDATLIDTLRRIAAERHHVEINGVLSDLWSASVPVAVWDKLRDDKRRRLLTLPSHK